MVRFAGGWLFDQAMAGWDVNVLTADHGDLRPLRILGARAHDLDAALAAPVVPGSCLQIIAVPAELYHREARVRRVVLHARSAEVRLWGDIRHGGETQPVRHRLSFAARAFKAHALAAVGVPAEASAEEFFCPLVRSGGPPIRCG